MKERFLTCIVCPKGCPLKVTFGENGKITEVTGYTCKRGLVYAETECTHPKRTVTSTVVTESGNIVSVKTSDTVPKEDMFKVMAEINKAVAKKGVKIGDVIIKNVCGSGADVVATSNE